MTQKNKGLFFGIVSATIVGILFPFQSSSAQSVCDVSTPLNTACLIDLDNVKPGQAAYGQYEVDLRVVGFNQQTEQQAEAFVSARVLPFVLGPGNTFHLVDGHHTAQTVLRSQYPYIDLSARIISDLTNLPVDQFWQTMEDNNWVWLNKLGVPITPEELPTTLGEMIDDPYRTLAAQVQSRGGFVDTGLPFIQFYWGDFFRSRVSISSLDAMGYAMAVDQALPLALSPAAADLPGYIGPSVPENGRTTAIVLGVLTILAVYGHKPR